MRRTGLLMVFLFGALALSSRTARADCVNCAGVTIPGGGWEQYCGETPEGWGGWDHCNWDPSHENCTNPPENQSNCIGTEPEPAADGSAIVARTQAHRWTTDRFAAETVSVFAGADDRSTLKLRERDVSADGSFVAVTCAGAVVIRAYSQSYGEKLRDEVRVIAL